MEAHYWNGSKTRSATLDFAITTNGDRVWITSHKVAGKVEARKLAKEAGATPWNF
jgi:hypothetical protein